MNNFLLYLLLTLDEKVQEKLFNEFEVAVDNFNIGCYNTNDLDSDVQVILEMINFILDYLHNSESVTRCSSNEQSVPGDEKKQLSEEQTLNKNKSVCDEALYKYLVNHNKVCTNYYTHIAKAKGIELACLYDYAIRGISSNGVIKYTVSDIPLSGSFYSTSTNTNSSDCRGNQGEVRLTTLAPTSSVEDKRDGWPAGTSLQEELVTVSVVITSGEEGKEPAGSHNSRCLNANRGKTNESIREDDTLESGRSDITLESSSSIDLGAMGPKKVKLGSSIGLDSTIEREKKSSDKELETTRSISTCSINRSIVIYTNKVIRYIILIIYTYITYIHNNISNISVLDNILNNIVNNIYTTSTNIKVSTSSVNNSIVNNIYTTSTDIKDSTSSVNTSNTNNNSSNTNSNSSSTYTTGTTNLNSSTSGVNISNTKASNVSNTKGSNNSSNVNDNVNNTNSNVVDNTCSSIVDNIHGDIGNNLYSSVENMSNNIGSYLSYKRYLNTLKLLKESYFIYHIYYGSICNYYILHSTSNIYYMLHSTSNNVDTNYNDYTNYTGYIVPIEYCCRYYNDCYYTNSKCYDLYYIEGYYLNSVASTNNLSTVTDTNEVTSTNKTDKQCLFCTEHYIPNVVYSTFTNLLNKYWLVANTNNILLANKSYSSYEYLCLTVITNELYTCYVLSIELVIDTSSNTNESIVDCFKSYFNKRFELITYILTYGSYSLITDDTISSTHYSSNNSNSKYHSDNSSNGIHTKHCIVITIKYYKQTGYIEYIYNVKTESIEIGLELSKLNYCTCQCGKVNKYLYLTSDSIKCDLSLSAIKLRNFFYFNTADSQHIAKIIDSSTKAIKAISTRLKYNFNKQCSQQTTILNLEVPEVLTSNNTSCTGNYAIHTSWYLKTINIIQLIRFLLLALNKAYYQSLINDHNIETFIERINLFYLIDPKCIKVIIAFLMLCFNCDYKHFDLNKFSSGPCNSKVATINMLIKHALCGNLGNSLSFLFPVYCFSGIGGKESDYFVENYLDAIKHLIETIKPLCIENFLVNETFSTIAKGVKLYQVRSDCISLKQFLTLIVLSNEGTIIRVQRQPCNSTRYHTSTISFLFQCLPINTTISSLVQSLMNTKNLIITTFKASSAGGQHANKTSSGVRIKHATLDLTVAVNQGRCQHANKKLAITMLTEKVTQLVYEAMFQFSQVGLLETGRSYKNETFHYKRQTVTYHTILTNIQLRDVSFKYFFGSEPEALISRILNLFYIKSVK